MKIELFPYTEVDGINTFADSFFVYLIAFLAVAITGVIGVVSLSNAGYAPPPGDIPQVSSVKGELPYLFREAQEWQEDVYLVNLEVMLQKNSYRLIIAEFHSPTFKNSYIVISLMHDGTYKSEIFPASYPSQDYPILDDEWDIDSSEALDYFSQNEDLRFCITSSGDHLISLRLAHLHKDKDMVVWVLNYSYSCPTFEYHPVYINGKSGELIIP